MEKPKQPPIRDDLDRPFYEAANEDRLILQYRPVDDCWPYPPEPTCGGPCGSAGRLEWRQADGSGMSYSCPVVSGTPITSSQLDQPFNRAVIELDDFQSIRRAIRSVGSDPSWGEAGFRRGSRDRAGGSQVAGRPVVIGTGGLRVKGQGA